MSARNAAAALALVLVVASPGIFARPFSIEDIISFVRVVRNDDADDFIVSSDGKRAAFVTSTGHAESGTIEYRLNVIERDALKADVCGRQAPLPAAAFTMSAGPSPAWTVLRSHRPGIEQLRWNAHASALLFLAGDRDDRRGIFKLDAAAARVAELVPVSRNILSFDVAGDRVAATVLDVEQTQANASTIATGIIAEPADWLMDVLNGPRSRKFISYAVLDYSQVADPVAVEKNIARLDQDATDLWLAPDGQSAVVLRVPKEFPAEWNSFQLTIPGLAREFSLLDMRTGQRTSLTGAPVARINGFSGPAKAFWLNDSKSVILSNTFLRQLDGAKSALSDTQGSFIVEVDKQTGRTTPIHELPRPGANETVRDIQFDASRARLTLDITEAGQERRIAYVRQRGGAWKSVSARSEERTSSANWISIAQSPTNPPAIRVEHRSGCTTTIPLNPTLQQLDMGSTEELRWQDASGRAWKAGLLLPVKMEADKRYPLVIQTHGYDPKEFLVDGPYGWATGGYAARVFAAHGIAVLQIEDRFDLIGQPSEGAAMSQAYLSAIEKLVERNLVDRDRVGLIGFSRTAYHVKYALTHHPEAFAAASVADGSDNGYLQYLAWYEDPPGSESAGGYARLYERQNGGQPYGSGLAAWANNAPGFMIDRVRAPVRILIPKSEALLAEWEWVVGLRRHRIPVEVAYTDAGSHLITYPAHRALFQGGNVDWFRFWLQDYEDGGPKKAEQYARWRELRKQRAALLDRTEQASGERSGRACLLIGTFVPSPDPTK